MSDWLSRKEAASLLHKLGCPISVRTLEKLAVNNNSGHGPPYTRFRWKSVRYYKNELIAWADKQTVRIK